MNLRYDLMSAALKGEYRHAYEVMMGLGIEWLQATPKTISDEWWFWKCKNIPTELPSYITELTINPLNAVGLGLSKEMAEQIISGSGQQE